MIKLHLGCGSRDFGDEWIHIDGEIYPHIQHHDVTKLPFPHESVNLIYASHLLEYFDRVEVVPVLQEWKRVLVRGGILRLAVPDFHTMHKLYERGEVMLCEILGPLYGRMSMGEEFIYHKTAYNFVELETILQFAGFSNVHRYDWRKTEHAQFDDHSQAYIPHMNKENGTLISLNVECQK